jgi:beta-galactosidase
LKPVLALLAFALAAHAQKLNFDPGWKFIQADPPNAASPALDDSKWSTVSLPHTFNDADGSSDWSGRTWYRKTFTPPVSMSGKQIFIEFEGVGQTAEVYLNGKLLGTSKNGFIPFGFNLTLGLRFGEKNVIAVMADNSKSPQPRPANGGIYRNVYLHVTDGLHISLPLFSFLQTAGPYVYATDISDRAARINIEVPIENDRGLPTNVEVVAQVIGGAGEMLAEWRRPGPMPAGGAVTVNLGGIINYPRLWEPAYPYLYTAMLSLRVGGQLVDTQRIPFGIRSARWDAATGLSINGHQLNLHGWSQQSGEAWPALGAALPDWLHFFTLAMMKDAGGNFIRWDRDAAAPAALDASDRLGLIAAQPSLDSEDAAAWRDTIVYYRNHPSILTWEGGAQELRAYMDQYDPHGGREIARLPEAGKRDVSQGRAWDASGQLAVNQIARYVKEPGANPLFSDSVDPVRFPKEAYYVSKTILHEGPQLYIIGHWTYPAGSKKTVNVASNAEEVELFLNGKSLGRAKPQNTYLFIFPDVAFEPGEIKAIAYVNGGQVATTSKHTEGPPVALKMTPIAAPGGWRADGSDVLLIDVEAIDANGDRCPTLQQRVNVEIQGPAIWRGAPYLELEAGVNRIALRSTLTAGEVTIGVKAEGLLPASITVRSNSIPFQNGYSVLLPALQAGPPLRPQGAGGAFVPVTRPAAGPTTGQFITAFTYSGPAPGVQVVTLAAPGKRAYVEAAIPLGPLPPELVGADYIEPALMDQLYITTDLMDVAVKAGTTITVAHDERIPPPSWLTNQFQATPQRIIVGGVPMILYQRKAQQAESLTLGSNGDRGGNMYLVFVK